MQQNINEIEINGTKYVRSDSIQTSAPSVDGMPLVVIRGSGFGYGK